MNLNISNMSGGDAVGVPHTFDIGIRTVELFSRQSISIMSIAIYIVARSRNDLENSHHVLYLFFCLLQAKYTESSKSQTK